MNINPSRTDTLIDSLTSLWYLSVKETHYFLNSDDITELRPLVEKFIGEIDILITETEDDTVLGFIGIADKKIEMLFVAPKYFATGIGRKLITYALDNYAVMYVDVNEQNQKAVNFYKHFGFEVFKRSEFDNQGNNFPILTLQLKDRKSIKIV